MRLWSLRFSCYFYGVWQMDDTGLVIFVPLALIFKKEIQDESLKYSPCTRRGTRQIKSQLALYWLQRERLKRCILQSTAQVIIIIIL